MNKIIIGAGIGLIVLIAFTLFITGLTNRSGQTAQNQTTPIPTRGFGPNAGSQGQSSNTTFFDLKADSSTFKQAYNPKRTGTLNSSEQQRLEKFLQIGDIETEDFKLAYSPYLNQFFVQLKTENGEKALDKVLAENNILDLKKKLPDLFVITEEDPRDAIAITEDQTKKALGEESINARGPTGKTAQQKDITFTTVMLGQVKELEKPKKPADPASGSGPSGKGVNCSGAKGNEKILCAARAYDGLPYKNSGPGASFGHPPSAWVQGYEGGNPSFRNLDCSGLVNVAMYKAFGQDMNAFSGTYYGDGRYRHVTLQEGRPGDIVLMGGPNGVGNAGHAAIFESFDGNHLQIFNSAGRGVRSETGDWMKTRVGFQVVRYVGSGSTP